MNNVLSYILSKRICKLEFVLQTLKDHIDETQTDYQYGNMIVPKSDVQKYITESLQEDSSKPYVIQASDLLENLTNDIVMITGAAYAKDRIKDAIENRLKQ